MFRNATFRLASRASHDFSLNLRPCFGQQCHYFLTTNIASSLAKGIAKPNRFASKYEQSTSKKDGPRHQDPLLKGGNSNFKKSGNGSNSANSGKGTKKHRGAPQTRTKTVRFNFDSGSEKAKSALKDIITRVQKLGTSYKVNFVSPESNKLASMHLVDIVNSTDFDKNGLLVIDPKTEGELPLIRVIKVQDMLKEYSDKLAAIKEKELLELGSFAAKRALNLRMQAEKKKGATKILTLSWSISVSDLVNQKKNEIMKRVNKGEKFIIFVGEKSSLYSARNSSEKEDGILKQLGSSRTKWDRMDEDELTLELKKRELVLEKLKELLDEAESKYEVSGALEARMMLNVTPKAKSIASQETEKELTARELKKLKKLAKPKEKVKVDEDELDSLYLFKIQD